MSTARARLTQARRSPCRRRSLSWRLTPLTCLTSLSTSLAATQSARYCAACAPPQTAASPCVSTSLCCSLAALRPLSLVQVTPTDLILADTDADGVTLRITDLGNAERVALTVPRADSTRTVVFTAPTADDLGELVGVVARDSLVADAPIMVELRLADELLQVARADAAGTFRFEGLPEGEYQLRLIADRDTSGTWTGGTLAPYTPPEALLLVPTPERVRPRWETVIDTLRFGTPPRPVLPTTPAADAAPPETGDG